LIITAREIRTDIRIVAKSVKDASAQKLIIAGASSVVQPNFIGGMRMASEMVRPAAASFLDVMLKEGKGDLRVEEVEIKNSLIKMLSDIHIQKTGILLLAVTTKSGYKFNPPQDTAIQSGDKLIVMGSSEQVSALKSSL
jgi:voltage-gated potassium channel